MQRHCVRALSRVIGRALPSRTMSTIKHNINYDTKHLKTGDPRPAFNGKLRVYNMRYCPFAQRTILALNAKNIDYEVVNIDLIDKPEWLTSISPFNKVPAIELKEGETVFESLVTVEYLDEIYPERPLLPKDPLKKAFDKIIVESIGAVQTMFFKLLKNPESVNEFNFVAYRNTLEFLEGQLKSRGTTFLDGSEPGYADYMIWPWFERMIIFEKGDLLKIDENKHPLLVKYLDNMKMDPAVKSYLIPKEIFNKFHEAYMIGVKPNYDLLLSSRL